VLDSRDQADAGRLVLAPRTAEVSLADAAAIALTRRVQPVGMHALPAQRADNVSGGGRQRRRRQERALFTGAPASPTNADAVEAFGRLVPWPEVLVADRPRVGERAPAIGRIRGSARKIDRE